MAIKTDGSLWAWGGKTDKSDKRRGELLPVKIMDSVAAVSVGSGHTLVIKTDGSLWTWGSNYYGQLGTGTSGSMYIISTPSKIMDSVVAISAGYNCSMAIRADGTLWAWGLNNYGQLGDDMTEERSSPYKVMDSVAAVSASGSPHYNGYTMAIKTDGSLWAWGGNYLDRLGIEAEAESGSRIKLPQKVMDNVVAVSAGYDHTIVVKADGSLWGWGSNVNGQLADSSMGNKPSPVRIMDITV